MVLGVTGGVGSGKSAVLDYLAENKGALVIKADEVARDISETPCSVTDEIAKIFAGMDALTEDGLMDREKVAKIVFNDPEKLKKLNLVLHKATSERIDELIRAAKEDDPDRLIVLESAIFFESGCGRWCDKVLYVYADEDTRFGRIKASRRYSREKFNSILTNQMSEKEFRSRCDLVADNSGEFSETARQLEALFS